jgi:uncharacterized membrane protein YqjE
MPEASSGLMESAKRLLSTLISIVSTRLELLGVELQEERLHLMQMFLVSLLALFSFGMGVMLLTVFIVVFFWDDHRLAVLGALCILFFMVGILATMNLRHKAKSKSKLFSISLAELGKDREELDAGHE